MSLFEENDLGAQDYSGEKESAFDSLVSKPVQRKYQPFGGQMPQAPQPQYEPIDYGYEVQPAQRQSNVFDELDAYDEVKKAHGQFKQYATENERSAKHYEGLYDDFVKNEFQPFFNEIGGFGDFDNDDEMLSFIDQMKADEMKASQEEDGFFGGSSDRKLAAQANLKKYSSWDAPNGMRDKYLRLKSEKDRRRQTADAARNQEYQLFEQLTNIPIPARDAMDAQIKARSASPRSKKATDDMLNQYSWQAPMYDTKTGEVVNLDKTDPRKSVAPIYDFNTGKLSNSSNAQSQRLSAAVRGDINGVLARRDLVKKERNLRDKGIFFSQNGLMDGRPVGLSRNDVDLLDIAKMKAAGMTSYRGKPLEVAMEELGGEERLKSATIMESVYGAKSNYEDAQLAFLKVAGSAKADKAREKMEAARDDMQKVISLAAENGLDNELFEQAESTSWLGGLGNAIQRGVLMSEMSNYTPDFLTNTLDADEMQRFIEIASEIEKLPTSSTMKRVRETKSDGFLDAMGNLLFDNPAAIPEMFVESLSSFLPATIKWLIPSAGAGAAVGAMGGPGGALAGAGIGAKASWGVASFVLEASGMALEGMQELGVDWKNPKVFAAAWTNESIRNKIQKKMVQKGVPIAAADMLTGFMAGKVMGVANHTGNAMFKGGKLLDKAAWNKSSGSVARFTTFQKTRNAAAELGFDSTMGMSGEFLGQWAAKEPGEAWDWDAIAAEGLVGVGPGVLSSALEMRGRNANYFANAPIEIGGEQTTETGTTGTVTRAGYSAPYQTFNDAESMGEYLSTLPNTNPEAVEFTKGWIAQLYAKNPEAMANLKIAISPRTPDANMENRGTFEARDGQTLIYLNEKEFSADPMATFMHEAGHLARVITMDEKQLMDVWNTIGKDAQLDAYAQYYTKRVGISFKDLDEATQAKVESAFNKTDNAVLAEEWFSYQFGQYLLGQNSQVENDVKAELKTYADQLGDAYAQYSGTDAKGKELFKLMFDQLGLGPAPETTINQPSAQPGINPDPQTALNAMPGTPKEKSMIARALNAMAGEKLLTESASFYTNMERQAVVAASEKEVDEQSEEGAEKKKKKKKEKKEEEKAPQKNYKQTQGPLLPAQEAKLRETQPEAKGSLPSQTEAAKTEMSQLDRLIPENDADRKNLGRALATVRQIEKTLTDEDVLNKRIDEAVKKLGKNVSVGSIIAEVLRFGPMVDAAPISIIKELRKEISQIERGEGKQRMQTTKAVEDMLAEARERIDDVVGQLENRVAEIDKQIDSLKKGADVKEAQKEIAALEEKKALAEAYIQVIAPEQRTLEWRDTVHSLYYVKRITKEGVSGKIPLTLGMLAKMKDFDKYEIYSSITDERQKKTENQKPHHVLWDFVNGGFDEKKVKGARNQPKPFLGGKSLNQYLMLLEAARASARWKQQKNIGSDAITTDSRVVSYPENFGEETTFGAVVAERIRRRMNRSVKDEAGNPKKDKDGKAIPQMERVPVFTENPTTEEVLALKIAGGATLEGLGDPSDSHKDFDMALYVIERQRMQEEQIDATEAGKADLIIDIYNQFEYAEESEDPFMRVKPGAPLSKTLAQIISLTARRQFLDKYDKVIKEDVEGEDGIQRSQVLNKMRERIDGQIVEGYTELVKNPKSKLFAQRLNAVVPYPKQLVKDQSTEVNTAGFEVKDEKNFNFRRPLEDTDVTVKAENGHDAFTASKVYETFDVMEAYAKGREKFQGLGWKKDFKKERTSIDQTEQKLDRPTTMETGADLLSSVDINAVDFAQWYLGGEKQSEKNKGDTGRSRAARQMIKLADIPSSQYTEKTINQLGGGLGEGLLPFVFADFVVAMHKKFGIKGFDDQIQTIRDRINEISQEQKNEKGTRTKEAGIIKPADLETLANDMVDVSKPIVQAVLDAEAIDVYGQFDPRSETVLERDTQMGEATDADENSAEMQDDSGNEDTQVASKKSDTDEKQTKAGETLFGRGDVDRVALQERIIKEYESDPKVVEALEGMSYEQLSEFMKEDMGKEVNELLQKELERRAIRRELTQAFTPDGSGRILNSDAGKPINDLNVVRRVIALTKKRIPFDRIAKLGSQWDYDELSAIHFKARDRSTYEGGKSDVQVAEELLKSLKSARAAMAEGDAEKAQQETAFIEKLMSNDMVMNNKWSDINDDPEAIDLQVEAEGFGGSISDLITKARKFKKDGTSPRTLNSDAGLGRRGFMKSMLMGFAAANIKTGAKVAGSTTPTDWSVLGRIMSEVSNDYDSADAASRDAYLDGGSAELVVREFVAHKKFLEVELENHKLWANFQIQVLSDSKLSEKEKTEKIEKAKKEYLKTDEYGDMWRGADQNHRIPRHFSLTPWYAEGTTNAEIIRSIKKEYATHKEFVQEEIQEIKENAEWNLEQYAVVKDGIASEKAKKFLLQAPSIFTSQALKALFPNIPAPSFKKLQSMPLKEAEQYVEKLLLENEKAQPSEINIQEERAKEEIPRTLNSDAGRVLTSDVNPNLKKATLLSKIAGDPEKIKEFQKWKKEKGESLKKGSFKMNFVDRADPLKQFHRGIVNILKKVGIDENHRLYDQLNVHGRLHQYFGKGYETVEQAQLRFIDPIKDLMREHGVDLKTFGEYLLARAAPSRNRQLKARADEYLADIAKEEKEGEGSAKYKKERAKYYKGKEFIVTSGIETDAAVKVVESMEQDKDFKAFAQKALPLYYNMNIEALDQLKDSGMIQEILDKEKKGVTGFRERTAMIKASSRFDWSKESKSSVIMPEDIGNYSYAPMQGFENETQNYLDGEAAWEEFGAAGTGAGKGFDQPKSKGILNPAFGRTTDYNGPDPEMVFATSINQYFNNAVLAKKNEVAQSFGSMFEAIRELTHPKESDNSDRGDNPNAEFQGRYLSGEAKGFLSDLQKLDDNMIAELKKEFDKIFESDYKMTEGKKLYEYPETGDKLIQVERQLSTVYKDDPLTFVYRRDGEAYLIKLKSTPEGLRMADTMKNLRYESLPSILQFFNAGTRFMARMFTSMNPAFIIPNFFRDLGTAAIHLSEDSKKKIFKDALNFKNLGKFAKAIFKTENMIAKGDNPNDNAEIQKLISLPESELAKSTHPLADIARYQVAKQNGAKIGYFRHASVPELIRDIQKDLKKSKKGLTKKGLKGLNDFVESSNTAIENSIRMSTYWAAIKGGYSPDEAAVIARNVTVDFNQKGNLTQALGSLYVFFGASMNSMHRFVTSWNRRSTKDKIAVFGGIAAASMTIAVMNRLLDDDEDEEVPDYDTITSYKRDTNFIVPLPAGLPEFFNDENDTGYFSIPLPLGYNLFWTMGQVAADMFAKNVMGRGGEGLIAGTGRLMESSMNAFNPIGGATIATIGTPSLVTPLIELYANKNFMGRQIRYEDDRFGDVPDPAYLQDPRSTPKHWTDLSKAINDFMGGSDTVKGSVKGMFGGNPLMYSSDEDLQFDLSGNQMRHALLGFLGGPGQILDSMVGAMITGVQGESSIRNVGDIPMVNRFIRATTYGSATRDTFREVREAVKNAEKAVKSAKNISPSTYTAVLGDNRELLKLSSSISQLDKQKNKMRRLKKQIEGSKTLTEEQKTQRVDDIQKKELDLMVKVIKQAQSLGIS